MALFGQSRDMARINRQHGIDELGCLCFSPERPEVPREFHLDSKMGRVRARRCLQKGRGGLVIAGPATR